MPKPERGIGHAFLRPDRVADGSDDASRARPRQLLLRAPAHRRCAATSSAGAARRSSRRIRDDLRVAVVGSGGLWHTPGAKDAYLDEDLRSAPSCGSCAAGDTKGMAALLRRLPDPRRRHEPGRRRARARQSPACPASAARRAARARPATGSPPPASPTAARHRRRLRADLRLAGGRRLRLLVPDPGLIGTRLGVAFARTAGLVQRRSDASRRPRSVGGRLRSPWAPSADHEGPHRDAPHRDRLVEVHDRVRVVLDGERVKQRQVVLVGGHREQRGPSELRVVGERLVLTLVDQRLDRRIELDRPVESLNSSVEPPEVVDDVAAADDEDAVRRVTP